MTARLPVVDSSAQFEWYKTPGEGDITYKYFENPTNVEVSPRPFAKVFYNHRHQFTDYSRINYGSISRLVKKYFTPSAAIYSIISEMEQKYELDYDNLCVLFYRGNDKVTETPLCSYYEYLIPARQILETNPKTKFLIQSDETGFLLFMANQFPGSIVFYDEIRHVDKCLSSVDIIIKDDIERFSMNYLAITVIMSKCRYVVCGSGNCSIWIMFYRGNCNGVYQNLNGIWLVGDGLIHA